MSGLEIKRYTNTAISVETQTAGNQVTADHFLWFARLLTEAVDAGMPIDTEIKIHNPSGVSGVIITARSTLVQEIP